MEPDRITVEPAKVSFPQTGGYSVVYAIATGKTRMAFKVKMTNIFEFRARPAYGSVEGNGKTKIEILRLDGKSVSTEKLLIEYAEINNEDTDFRAPFRAGGKVGECWVTMEITQ